MAELLINKYLAELVKRGGSDMYITVGHPVAVRMQNDELLPIEKKVMQQADIKHFINEILDDDRKAEFEEKWELNVSLELGDKQRFRCNFFRQQQRSGMVIRRIITDIPTIEDLKLPEIYEKVIMNRSGLIILASPGGSGKSTSMAAMLEYRNINSLGHIVTIEDPIEYVHEHKGCIFTQREVGSDTHSYHAALRSALRQRADVVAIGEIRDRESMDHALRFSETGHLCIATLHSNSSGQAIDRMSNFFSDDARRDVLSSLSHDLLAVFSQRIIDGVNQGEKVVAVDILLNEGLVKNQILEDSIAEIPETQERMHHVGMQTFDQSLFDLFVQKKISLETALEAADNPSSLKLRINQSEYAPN